MATCTICSNRAARAVIDAALLSGERPSVIIRSYAENLGLSASAVYRHARSHRPQTTLATSWLGDSTTGDVVADVAAQRRSHTAERERALLRGDSSTASREGHEALAASLALLKLGIDSDDAAQGLATADHVIRAVQTATKRRPEFATELADAARELDYVDLADDADALAASATEYFSRNTH